MDAEDEWPQSHLGYDQHRRHLTTDPFLDAATGTAPYLYGKLSHLSFLQPIFGLPFCLRVPAQAVHIATSQDQLFKVLCYAGHSGLTGSRLDDTLPLLNSNMLFAGLPGQGLGLEQAQWALAGSDKGDQGTATSPLRPPVRSSSSFSGEACYLCQCAVQVHCSITLLHGVETSLWPVQITTCAVTCSPCQEFETQPLMCM